MGHAIMTEILTYLTLMGFWPRSPKSSKASAFLIILSTSFLFFGILFYLIVNRQFGSSEIDSIETITSQFGVLYYLILFTWKRNDIVEIVELLSDFSKFGKPPFFDQRSTRLNYRLSCIVLILIVANIVVAALPVIYIDSCHKANEQLNLTKTCGLIAPVWLPFDYNEYPRKHLVFAWEVYCCVMNYVGSGIGALTMVGTMEHVIIRIEQLKYIFPKILDQPNPRIREQMLKNWVRYHLALFEIGRLMNDAYKWSLSVIVLCVGALFACIGISMLQSLSVGTAVYSSRWYDMDVAFQKSVLMILIRSQKPIRISVGPFTHLSMLLLLGVFQSAYSYINLLNATS
ncbi:odorant receptor 67c isoform X2 [Tribolium castaneum]|uniref:odorant receptor 67c isoform X2 n=1 Tax=Tribolium castaneum TaxID=7070 RepID=UPI00077DC237|nr:PREDICTED: odorant receptor 67c-like isoform X2 [Tribolium castaneum]|eukprot:XP_015838991.1 PREDICTED: odorant receptor 67c-like isoform X2 [Tribolium castaneum]